MDPVFVGDRHAAAGACIGLLVALPGSRLLRGDGRVRAAALRLGFAEEGFRVIA
jgi:hypothetical protein